MPQTPLPRRLDGRICLITGASRGLGAALAEAFAAEGAQTILVARTQKDLQNVSDKITAAGGLTPVLAPLDLTDFAAVDALGGGIFSRFGRLDVMVANAAMLGALGPLAQSDADKFSDTLALNLTANYRLIRAMDPLLRASESGTAIFVTAGVARTVMPYWGAYAVSKVALEQLAQLYAAETARTPLKVHLIDPGTMRTALRAEAFPGENPEDLPSPAALADTFIEMAMANNLLATGSRIRATPVLSTVAA